MPVVKPKQPTGPKEAIIHFLYEDMQNGPIASGGIPNSKNEWEKYPEGVRRFAVACQPTAKLPKHATGEPRAATCPDCQKTDIFKAKMAYFERDNDLVEAAPEDFPEGCDSCGKKR